MPQFNPVTDIYQNSDYAQQVANQYMGNQYSVPGFNSGDSNPGFVQNYQRGYYQQDDERSMAMMIAATTTAMLTNRTALPWNRRSLARNISSLENSQNYAAARNAALQQVFFERMAERAQSAAIQRNYAFTTERENNLRAMIESPFGSMGLSAARAAMPPSVFESYFGRGGSGLGMFDAAYSTATYKIHDDGSRWTPQERALYATQAMNKLYLDPQERNKRRLDSVQGGELWSHLQAKGLIGNTNDEDYLEQSSQEITQDVTTFFMENEVSPYTGAVTRKTHEKVQKAGAINAKRRALSRLKTQMAGAQNPEQHALLTANYHKELGDLFKLEESYGLSPERTDPKDMSSAVRAMRDLQEHQERGVGFFGSKEQFDKKTEELAGKAHDALQAADIGSPQGKAIGLASLKAGTDVQNITSSLEQAEAYRKRYAEASSKKESPISREEVEETVNEYLRGNKKVGIDGLSSRLTEIDKIETDVDRSSTGVSVRRHNLTNAVEEWIQAERTGDVEASQVAKRQALEIAGGGGEAMLIVDQVRRELTGKSLDLDFNDKDSYAMGEELVRGRRAGEQATVLNELHGSLFRGGMSQDLGNLDLSELPLDELVSMQEAMLAITDDPRLDTYMKNASILNRNKGKFGAYESAIKALQESMTNREDSPSRLMETLMNFNGGNLHQLDPTQLEYSVRKTYALARQLGQGDEFVAATMAQSQNMLASMNVNPAFSNWHGMQSLLHHAAAAENPNYRGVWGAQMMQDVAANQDRNMAAFLASDAGNQFGAALRLQETYGQFAEGTNAANYMKALEAGETTFLETVRGNDGKLVQRQRSVQLSENMFMSMAAEGIGNGDVARTADVRAAVGSTLRDRSSNLHMAFKNQDKLADAAHAQQSAAFVTGSATGIAAALLREGTRLSSGMKEELGGLVSNDSTKSIVAGISSKAMDRMMDSTEFVKVRKQYKFSEDDTELLGKVQLKMMEEEALAVAKTATPGSDQQKVAAALSNRLQGLGGDTGSSLAVTSVLNQAAGAYYGTTAVSVLQQHDRNLLYANKKNEAVARAETREATAFRDSVSDRMSSRIMDSIGSGATAGEILMASMQVYNLQDEHPLMIAYKDYQRTNAKVTALDNQRINIQRMDDSEEKKQLLTKNSALLEVAHKNLQSANNNLQPALLEHRTKENALTNTEFDNTLGADLDLLNQVITVKDKDTKGYKLQLLQKDQVRHKGDGSGRLEYRDGETWKDKTDAVYLGQFSNTNASGETEYQYKKLTHDEKANTWSYFDDAGKKTVFDVTQPNQKMVTGTSVFAMNDSGESVKTNMFWSSDGTLMQSSNDGRGTSVVTDREGIAISSSSEFGKSITAGMPWKDLKETTINSNKFASVTQAQYQANLAHSRGSLKNPETERYEKIAEFANERIAAYGAVPPIEPRKVEFKNDEGKVETFYTVLNPESDAKTIARYKEAKKVEAEDIQKFLDADDAEVKNDKYSQDEDLVKARNWYRTMGEKIKEHEEVIANSNVDLGSAVTESDKDEYNKRIETSKSAIAELTSSQKNTVNAASVRVAERAVMTEDLASAEAPIEKAQTISLTPNHEKIIVKHDKDGKYKNKKSLTSDELTAVISDVKENPSEQATHDRVDLEKLQTQLNAAVAEAAKSTDLNVATTGKAKTDGQAVDAVPSGSATFDISTGMEMEPGQATARGEAKPLDRVERQTVDYGANQVLAPGSAGPSNARPMTQQDAGQISMNSVQTGQLPQVSAEQASQNCVLNAGTVHLKIDNMTVHDGSISVRAEGQTVNRDGVASS